MNAWIFQQHDTTQGQFAFDVEGARKHVGASLSPYTEYNRIGRQQRWEIIARMAPFSAIPLAGVIFIVGLLWRGRVRRIAWTSSLLGLFSVVPAMTPKFVSELLVPGTYAFLDDNVYLETVDLRHPKGDIAAYDWRTFSHEGMRRRIAFDDGHVEAVPDDRARQLFEQQGIPYPAPKDERP